MLQLAYFSEEGLPDELLRIPLEYFRTASEWLGAQEGIDSDRIVVFGVSRGGELALLLGSTYPDLVHAVVAYVPSSSVFPAIVDQAQPAWTLRGAAVPSEAIAVERISGGVFLVGGRSDALWPSGPSVELIVARLRANGRHDFTALNYERAGHAVGIAVPNTYTQTIVKPATARWVSAARRRRTRPRAKTRGPSCSASSRVSDGRVSDDVRRV